MTIDFHAHMVSPLFRRCISELGIDPLEDDGFPLPEWSPEAHIEFMNDAGITRTILSVPPPHIHNGDDSKSCTAARKINIDTAELCRKFPDKFSFVGCVPLPCVDGAIREAEFVMRELGAVGVRLSTNSNGIYLGDKSLDAFMEALNELEALAVIHPCRARPRPSNVITGKAAAIYEYPTDTTRAVLNMMQGL